MIRRLLALVSSSALVAAVLVVAPSPAYASGSGTISNHGGSAPVYSGPGDMHSLLRTVGAGVRVSFHCYVRGQIVTGDYAPSNAWDALDGGGYIADALVYTGSDKPIVGRCPWNEFGSNRFPVAYTGGSGFDPRVNPSRGSSVGAGHLPDGTIVTVTCETTGESVTDSIPYTTNLWDRLDNGTYVPNAFLDTETDGPTPGMSTCTSDPPPGGGPGPGGSGSGGGKTPTPQSNPETCQKVEGVRAPSSHLSEWLFKRFEAGYGSDVVIPWSYFSGNPQFVTKAKSLNVGEKVVGWRAVFPSDMYFALGAFTIKRTSEHCYWIYDIYDFDKIKEFPLWLQLKVKSALPFNEYSSGKL